MSHSPEAKLMAPPNPRKARETRKINKDLLALGTPKEKFRLDELQRVLLLVGEMEKTYQVSSELKLEPFEENIPAGFSFYRKIGEGDNTFYCFIKSTGDMPFIVDVNGTEVVGIQQHHLHGSGVKFWVSKENAKVKTTEIFSTKHDCHVRFPAIGEIQAREDGFYLHTSDGIIVMGKNGLQLEISGYFSTVVQHIVCTEDDMAVATYDILKNKQVEEKLVTVSGYAMEGCDISITGLQNFNNEWRALVSRKTKYGYDYSLVTKEKTIKIDSSLLKRKDRLFHNSWPGFIKDGQDKDDITTYYLPNGEKFSTGLSSGVFSEVNNNRLYYGILRKTFRKMKFEIYNEAGRISGEFAKKIKGLDDDIYLVKSDKGQSSLCDDDGKLIAGPFRKGEKIVNAGRAAGKVFITLLIGQDNKIVDNLDNQINIPPIVKKVFDVQGKAYFLSGQSIYDEKGQVAMVLVSASTRAFNNQIPMNSVGMRLMMQNGLLVAVYLLEGQTSAINRSDGNWIRLHKLQVIDVAGNNYYIGECEPDSEGAIIHRVHVYDADLKNTFHDFDQVINTEVSEGKLFVTGIRNKVLVRELID